MALVAIVIATGALLRSQPSSKPTPAPTYSNQQVADARAKVCGAYAKVHHAVIANTGRPGDTDPASLLGLAANARIALFDSGEYLLEVLAQQPAIPIDLADATRALANAYQELAMDYMAEASDPQLETSRQVVETTGSKVSEMCK